MAEVLTIGLNPAFEHIYVFSSFNEGEVNRAKEKHIFASGRGINTTRVFNLLGDNALNLTQLGGARKDEFLTLAENEHIFLKYVESNCDIRTCTTLVNAAKGTSTELVEESDRVGEDTSSRFIELFLKEKAKRDAVVISGSRASGYEKWLIPSIVNECKIDNIKVILDIKGEDLLESLKQRPYLIKINFREFAETFKLGEIRENENNDEIKRKTLSLMKELYRDYGTMTLISRGKLSSLYFNGREEGEIEVEKVNAVNTIGCGDALTAAVTHYLLEGKSLKEAATLGGHVASRAAESATLSFKL